MTTIHAICENGVFRPTEPVDLPEGNRVTLRVEPDEFAPQAPDQPDDADLDEVYEVLSRRHRSGHRDTAERHDG